MIRDIQAAVVCVMSLVLGGQYVSAQESSSSANLNKGKVYYFEGDHHVELEGAFEFCFGMPKFRDMNSALTSGWSFEARYRFTNCPVDIGAYVCRTFAGRNWGENPAMEFYHTNLMLTGDYNYRLGRFFTAFGGLGIGVVKNMTVNDENAVIEGGFYGMHVVSQNGPKVKFAIMPRIGVTACNLLRVTVGYKINGKINSHAFVSLGLTWGLGRIKR